MDRGSGSRCSRMMREVCAAVAVLVSCVLSTGVAYDQVPEGARSEREVGQAWTCAMHAEVRTPKPGQCPICLMNLIAVAKKGQLISVPEGELQQFCESYIEDALDREEEHSQWEAFCLVLTYAHMKGKDAAPRLRGLLAGSDLDYVRPAAIGLGQLGDRQSIERMKELLASERFQIRPEGWRSEPEMAIAWLDITGALHAMGEPEGLSALLEVAQEEYGAFAFGALTVRDTPEVRDVLTRAAASDRGDLYKRKARAITALLYLGEKKYVPEAVKLLASEHEMVRWEVLAALVKIGGPGAEDAVMQHLSRDDISTEEKCAAAEALIRLGRKRQGQSEIEAVANAQREAKLMKLLEDNLAVDYLGAVGTEEQLPLLRRIIEQDPGRRLQAVAAAINIFHRENEE